MGRVWASIGPLARRAVLASELALRPGVSHRQYSTIAYSAQQVPDAFSSCSSQQG
jgi:hypothetical protein